jgi:hypothetical protein
VYAVLRGLAGAVVVWFGVTALSGAPQAGRKLDVTARDQSNLAIPGVRVELSAPDIPLRSAQTSEDGHAQFFDLKPAKYRISLSLKGFETITTDLDLTVSETSVAFPVTMKPAIERTKVEVTGEATAVEQGSSPATSIGAKTAGALPDRPSTVADALPLIPGVVREPGGALVISDSPEHRAALIVNSADVTDPATGQFGLTVPMDSVEAISVYQTPFLAEYGRFTAGLVSVATRRGGDQWKWELNDPFPEFRIRSWQLRGLKNATPRINFEGPILARKLFLSQGLVYEIRKTAVYTLPFPDNQKLQQGLNSFTQLDWVTSSRQLVTATFHLAPQRMSNWNINYFNPIETSPDARTTNYTGTVSDRLSLGSSYWENTFSVTNFDFAAWGKGETDLFMTPTGNRGNYFANKARSARRTSGLSTFALAPIRAAGEHHFKIGSYAASSAENGRVDEQPVNILNTAGSLIERITFNRIRNFEISDVELSFFAQDHWIVSPRLSLDLGARVESQQISGAYRGAPRAGFAWNPIPDRGLTVRGGFGYFYDRVPLNVFSFNRFPDQVVTRFNDAGAVLSGPTLYLNTLGQTRVRHPFLFQQPKDGNFSPRSATWSLQLEQPAGPHIKLRAGYTQSLSDGLVILNPTPVDPETGLGSYLLSGTGGSRYRQFETVARFRAGDERELMLSYVRSKGRGDLNDFGNFLGTFPVPIVRSNEFGNLPADLPNRFLAWGIVKLPGKFRVSPVVEYRSGFPYLVRNAHQDWVGIPNDQRFPRFFSVDSRISKDFQVKPKYALRLALASFNLTNHFNPEAVHGNVADPAYGLFFGHRGRRFTMDFDVLF